MLMNEVRMSALLLLLQRTRKRWRRNGRRKSTTYAQLFAEIGSRYTVFLQCELGFYIEIIHATAFGLATFETLLIIRSAPKPITLRVDNGRSNCGWDGPRLYRVVWSSEVDEKRSGDDFDRNDQLPTRKEDDSWQQLSAAAASASCIFCLLDDNV
jgi:hypothetical protein